MFWWSGPARSIPLAWFPRAPAGNMRLLDRRRRRHRRERRAVASFDGLPDRLERYARVVQLHRLTGDVEADASTNTVRFPGGHAPSRVSRSHETVVIVLVPAVLAAAEARHLAQHFRVIRGEGEHRADDFQRPGRGRKGHRGKSGAP